MAERALAVERLSAVPSNQILHFLRDEVVFEIVANVFPSPPPETILQLRFQSQEGLAVQAPSKPQKPTRALNAFMAFRSYYVKLFPDVQQKTASGFLTTLWNQDASGNKWAVIARLYSYVRDEIGRPKVSLSEFLSFACPHMQIVRPEKYLEESGWRLEDGTGGCKTLVRVSSKPAHTGSTPLSVPHTEIELLICLVQDGYLSDKGLELLESLSASHQGLMTSHAGSGERKTTRDHAFNRFRASPTPSPAASNVFTPINKVEVETPASDKWFGFSSAASSFSCGEVLNIERVPEQQPFDIDNPWDVSRSFQCSTEQTHLESPASTQYDPREDFHYQF